ncbi:MAG: DnaA regulatory inactivator Hda [Gammaproteobacteria bacterium]
MPIHPQLPLGLRLQDNARFENFHAGPHAELVRVLRQCAAGDGEPSLYIWGPPGTGKSHLLQAVCRDAEHSGSRVAYLPLAELSAWPPDIIEGLEQMDLVCADDVEAIAGRRDWEEALFHLFNRLRGNGGRLVAAGARRPGEVGLALADLVSRLSWGPVYPLSGLDDENRLQALQLRARRFGLELPAETARYLLRRYPRDLAALFGLLDRLDREALAAQRRLTVPFVKAVLEGRENGD